MRTMSLIANNAAESAEQNGEDWHMCSLVVQGKIEKLTSISTALSTIKQTEIYAINEEMGKIVAVMQAPYLKALADKIEQAKEIDGVITVSPVYYSHLNEK